MRTQSVVAPVGFLVTVLVLTGCSEATGDIAAPDADAQVVESPSDHDQNPGDASSETGIFDACTVLSIDEVENYIGPGDTEARVGYLNDEQNNTCIWTQDRDESPTFQAWVSVGDNIDANLDSLHGYTGADDDSQYVIDIDGIGERSVALMRTRNDSLDTLLVYEAGVTVEFFSASMHQIRYESDEWHAFFEVAELFVERIP